MLIWISDRRSQLQLCCFYIQTETCNVINSWGLWSIIISAKHKSTIRKQREGADFEQKQAESPGTDGEGGMKGVWRMDGLKFSQTLMKWRGDDINLHNNDKQSREQISALTDGRRICWCSWKFGVKCAEPFSWEKMERAMWTILVWHQNSKWNKTITTCLILETTLTSFHLNLEGSLLNFVLGGKQRLSMLTL